MKHLSILILLAISAAHENHIQPIRDEQSPEPSTVILMGTGVAMLVAWQWRKKRKK